MPCLKKISEQIIERPYNRNEMLRLMIYLKSLKRAETENDFECYVVDAHEFKDFLHIINTHPPASKNHRLQILVRNDVHYTSVDIKMGGNQKECLVMDAALDERFMGLIEDLKQSHFNTIYVAGIPAQRRAKEFADVRAKINESLQLDTFSCSAFGFHLLSRSSKKKDLFEFLDKSSDALDPEEGVRYLSWKKFPPDFVQTAQYPKFFLQKEISQTKEFKKEKNLSTWIKQHFNTIEEGNKKRETNALINKKFVKYGKQVCQAMHSLSKGDIAQIACTHPNTVYMNNHAAS